MTLQDFRPEGVTGNGEVSDMFFHSEVTGPDGARYSLLKERHHTGEDLKRAQRYLRHNFDVVKISVIKEK